MNPRFEEESVKEQLCSRINTPASRKLESRDSMRRTKSVVDGALFRECVIGLGLIIWIHASCYGAQQLTKHVSVEPGPVNRVSIQVGEELIAIYGLPRSTSDELEEEAEFDYLLLTHHRRDVIWAASDSNRLAFETIAPESERELIEAPNEFWANYVDDRFGDMAQQSTKILTAPISVNRWVKGGDWIESDGSSVQVLDTPGFTRGSVSYLLEIDDERLAFVGDLIYGDGQVIDLYSFQDSIPEAKIRGYHGYGSRLAGLIESLRKIAEVKPTIIVPARGPVIHNPNEAIERLISRLQAVYRNYLSTNALHWYFKADNMTLCGQRILGQNAEVQLMPYSEHVASPDWVWEFGTARMIISKNKRGFLLDCWNQSVIDAVNEMIQNNSITGIDGIFVTHYHDDHTAMVQAAAEQFECKIYAIDSYVDILEQPGAYHMPALTRNAMKDVEAIEDGTQVEWEEYKLTYHFFPGQTIYHGALFVEHPEDQPILFVGDSFAPSGFDDYCVLNRNLLHEDQGYLLCLRKLREIDREFWIINQHIPFVFRFTPTEIDYLESRYRERINLLRDLFPWDDPNYGVDEQWAVCYPYGTIVSPDSEFKLQVRLTNHSPNNRLFEVHLNVPQDAAGSLSESMRRKNAMVEPGTTRVVEFVINAPDSQGDYVFTADVQSEGMEFMRWTEAIVSVR